MNQNRKFNSVRALIPFLILLIGIGIFSAAGGCETNFTQVKMNRTMVNEYNDAINDFNDFSRAFTALGQKMDRTAEKETETDAKFWRETKEEIQQIRSMMANQRKRKFTWEEFEQVKEVMEPLFTEATAYLDEADALAAQGAAQISADTRESLRTGYRTSIEKSGDVVNSFDTLYMDFVSKSKEEQ